MIRPAATRSWISTAAGSLTMRYLWGPTGILARETSGGTVSWYLADALGTVRDLINNSGSVIDHVDCSAFGTVLDESSPTSGDRFVSFAGLERDTVTGLNLAVEREENPGTGRWDSPDPIGFAAGSADLYVYVGDMPADTVDTSGLVGVVAYGAYGDPLPTSGGRFPGPGGGTMFRPPQVIAVNTSTDNSVPANVQTQKIMARAAENPNPSYFLQGVSNWEQIADFLEQFSPYTVGFLRINDHGTRVGCGANTNSRAGNLTNLTLTPETAARIRTRLALKARVMVQSCGSGTNSKTGPQDLADKLGRELEVTGGNTSGDGSSTEPWKTVYPRAPSFNAGLLSPGNA
jgi:RHS repeat-associated protein